MLYSRKRIDICFPSSSLPIVPSLTILGVRLNNRLKWDNHIRLLCKKASQRLHILRSLKQHVSKQELLNVYLAIIRSVADYCCPTYVKIDEKLVRCLRRIERRAHRIIFDGTLNGYCNCALDGFRQRRELLSLKLFNKITQNRDHILQSRMPSQLKHSHKLSNFFCRTSTRQNSFIPYTTLLANR